MKETKQLDLPINPGQQLDHYRIDSLVKRSPVATTYRATDLVTNLSVALKIPHPELESDPIFAERFRREQEIGARFDHPGVIRVLIDQHRSQTYMVSEWFEGRTLRDVLSQEKRLPPDRAVHIAVEICDAIEYIHGQGIVHCNLKPESVLVGADDRIRLIHFGDASKVVARRLTFTKLAQIEGTSEYISPEELKGKRPSAQSDIYALGVILYEMLTGKLPFESGKPLMRLRTYPEPPREIDPQISPQLQEIIYRALEREPKNRYAKARDLERDLIHQDQVGVADRPEFQEWKRQRSLAGRRLLLYVALALIPIVILALLLYLSRR